MIACSLRRPFGAGPSHLAPALRPDRRLRTRRTEPLLAARRRLQFGASAPEALCSVALFPGPEACPMTTRTGSAVWEARSRAARATCETGQRAPFEGAYSFSSRFGNGGGTNPEELIGAAEAGCFSMALSFGLEKAGYPPNRISTTANVTLAAREGGFASPRSISRRKPTVRWNRRRKVPGAGRADEEELHRSRSP